MTLPLGICSAMCFWRICSAVCYLMCFPFGMVVKNLPASTGDLGLIPGSRRFTGERNGKPPQYSCLENPMDREDPGRLPSMGSLKNRYSLVTKQQQQTSYLKPQHEKKMSGRVFLKFSAVSYF